MLTQHDVRDDLLQQIEVPVQDTVKYLLVQTTKNVLSRQKLKFLGRIIISPESAPR